MNDTELEELLALYALGLLKESDRARLQNVLDQFPRIDKMGAIELQQARETLALLSYGTEPLTPSSSLRHQIWERIQAEPPSIHALQIQRSQDRVWQPHPVAGVQIALLQIDEQRREVTALFRAEGPVDYPTHDHKGPEDIFMFEGDLEVGPILLGPGDFIRSEVGSRHPHATRDGCVCLVRSCMDDAFLDLDAPLPAEAHFPFILNRGSDRTWSSAMAEGSQISVFCDDPARHRRIGLGRIEPGVQVSLSQWEGLEEIFIISGDLIVEEQVVGPGDYLRSPQRSLQEFETQLGCSFFFMSSLHGQ